MTKKLLFTASMVGIFVALRLFLSGSGIAVNDPASKSTDVSVTIEKEPSPGQGGLDEHATVSVTVGSALFGSKDIALHEAVDFEYEWQFSIGKKARLELLPAYPTQNVRDLIDASVIGASAQDDFEVFKALQFCADAPRDRVAYEARQLELLTTRSPSGVVVVDDTRAAEQMLSRKFQLCEGIESSDFDIMEDRIKSASDLGLPLAKLEYGEYLIGNAHPSSAASDLKERHLGLIEEAKKLGVADALYWSGFYGANGVSGQDRVSTVASSMVAEAIYREYGLQIASATIVDREYRLLYPEQRNEARALALEMAASKSCCVLTREETKRLRRQQSNDEKQH